MGLRNAFDEIGLESTLRKILAAVTYARTPSDVMRVNVENTAPVVINNQPGVYVWTANNNTPMANQLSTGYYNQHSWNINDARETARQATETQFLMTRQRWSIT